MKDVATALPCVAGECEAKVMDYSLCLCLLLYGWIWNSTLPRISQAAWRRMLANQF